MKSSEAIEQLKCVGYHIQSDQYTIYVRRNPNGTGSADHLYIRNDSVSDLRVKRLVNKAKK